MIYSFSRQLNKSRPIRIPRVKYVQTFLLWLASVSSRFDLACFTDGLANYFRFNKS